MIDLNWYGQATDGEKLWLIKSFEGLNIKHVTIENVKYVMKIIEVVDLDNIVVRFVSHINSRMEFLNDGEFIQYLYKLNKYTEGEFDAREKVKTSR